MNKTGEHRRELIYLYLATFLLRTGFGGVILIFDWVLVWGIEHALGVENTTSTTAILIISFSAITYYLAEIGLTGYYGNKSDTVGVKPVIMYATVGGAITMLLYAPTPYIFSGISNMITALYLMTLYLAIIHFTHGIFASAKVAPTLGFINKVSSDENRALNMSFYDNAILYGRAFGIMLGGALWILMGVDSTNSVEDQARLISFTFPVLSGIIFISALMIKFGIKDLNETKEKKDFSIKEDIRIAATVMLEPNRKPLLLPWLSIAALIGSASLWGPTVSYILSSSSDSSHRGWEALLPLMVILVGLALPAPLWGIYADRKGKKKTLKMGLFGLPIAGVLGLAVGYPFFKDDISLSNIYLLLSIVPATFMFSAMIPVLMGILGDTAEDKHDGKVMSGYHFVIAFGEIIGILVGGLFIGFFGLLQSAFGWFGEGTEGSGMAILIGFVLFELILVAGMIIGILKLPDNLTND